MAAPENEVRLCGEAAKTQAPARSHAGPCPSDGESREAKTRDREDTKADAERAYATNWWGGGHSLFGGFGSWATLAASFICATLSSIRA